MKKDVYYFPHDSNAKDDPKCVFLIEQLGLEGYGIYWVLIETLRDQPNYKYPFALTGALARRFNTTKEKLETVIKRYNLFDFDDNDFFFSQSLLDRMEGINKRRKALQEAGRKGGKSNAKATLKPGYSNKIKEKEIKLKENILYKEILRIYNSTIDLFQEDLKPDEKEKINWLDEIRMLIEIDGKNPEEIISVIRWGRLNDFWKTNFLSIRKLRKKDSNGTKFYVRFLTQMNNGKDSNTQQKQRSIFEDKNYPAHWD